MPRWVMQSLKKAAQKRADETIGATMNKESEKATPPRRTYSGVGLAGQAWAYAFNKAENESDENTVAENVCKEDKK